METSDVTPGARVGAVQLGDDRETMELFGFGVYDGEIVPDEPVGRLRGLAGKTWDEAIANAIRAVPEVPEERIREALMEPNPRITLDSGEIIWGCECWWGPEEKIKDMLSDTKVVDVSITDLRIAYDEAIDKARAAEAEAAKA